MVEERPSSPKFFTVTSFFLVVLVLQFNGGWTAPQIPNDQYQANIYIPQAQTDFSHPSEAEREYSQPTAPAVNHVPLQEEHHNERPDYETQPNEEDYINPADRPRGRPYAGSFAEELDGATGEEDPEKSIPGSPEQDYPVFEEIPRTSFSCRDKPVPAYYADVEARCQVFHICDVGGHKHSFLCPNGSVFNQKYLVCDWWYDFACENAENLFSKQLLDATTTTQNDRQTFSDDRQTFSNDRQTFSKNGQTFSNDGQLIYSQNPTGDYNLNQGFLNPGLPQTQLDTPQQVYTGNYYVPQNDIFHGAETGFPGRDLIHANSENARKNDENNVNNTGNVNTNIEGFNNGDDNNQNNVANLNSGNANNANLNNGNVNNNANLNNGNVNNANSNNGEFNNGNFNNGNANNGNLNHENVNIGNYNNENSNNGNLNYGGNSNDRNFNNGNANFNTRDLNSAGSNQGNFNNENLNNENFKTSSYNKESLNSTYNNQNVIKNGEEIYNSGNSNSKNQARSYIEGKNLDNFQNRQDEPPRNRKQYKVGRRRHDYNSKQSTTQSSLNTGEKIPDKTQVKVNLNPVGTSVGEIHEQGHKNIVNDTVALQRNNGENNNYYNNEQRTESNGNSFQANVNSFSQPQPNTQYIPQNTFREANNNNVQNNQYTI